MHKNCVGDFDCLVFPPPWLMAKFNLHAHETVLQTDLIFSCLTILLSTVHTARNLRW